MITASGVNLSKQNNVAYFKITSNNGATGYTWFMDKEACERIVDMESGYVYYEPENNDEFDLGYGEEIFTLTAKKYGSCTFRIAYARSWEWVDFRNHENNDGYMLEIPIRVLQGSSSGSSGSGSNDNSGTIQGIYDKKDDEEECDATIENCEIKEQLGIGWREKRAFRMIGI